MVITFFFLKELLITFDLVDVKESMNEVIIYLERRISS